MSFVPGSNTPASRTELARFGETELRMTAERLGLNLREATVGTPEQIERAHRDAQQSGMAGVVNVCLMLARADRAIE